MPRPRGTLRDRLAGDPTAWATLLRHAVPVVFVFVAGWSALETLVSLLLDAASVLLCLAAVASTIAVRSLAHDEQDLRDRLDLVAGGVVVFAVIAFLLLFALAVPAAAVWVAALRGNEPDLLRIARDPSLHASFAGMLAFQVPRYLELVRTLDAGSARRVVAPEVGFVLARFVLVGGAAGLLALLPAGAALVGTLIVVQGVLAATEILADEHLAWLSRDEPGQRPAPERRRR
jgi:hypothetical protein